jgi:hypothetical protein
MGNLSSVGVNEVALAEKSALVGGLRFSSVHELNFKFSFGLLSESYEARRPMNVGRTLFTQVMEYMP